MSKKTLLLIVFLLLLTGIFVFIAVSQNSTPTQKQSAAVVAPTKKPSQAFTTLAFSSPVVAGNTQSVDVMIDTHGVKNKVTAVQLELSYDPAQITTITAKPGPFLENSFALISPSDPKKTGRVTYALAISPTAKGKSGSGVVATLSFQTLSAKANTTIHLLSTSLVTAEGIAQSVLKTTGDVPLTIGSSGSSSSPSPVSKH